MGLQPEKLRNGRQQDSVASRTSQPSGRRPIRLVVERQEPSLPPTARPTKVHRVERGETLFEIAGIYFEDENRRLDQAMLWLYEANRSAFGSSMNVLFEGAVLRVPNSDDLRMISASVARAEVDRHIELWEREHAPASEGPEITSSSAPSSELAVYGPVARGETLSAIAERARPEGVSLDQMMRAVFDANPQAFGGRVDVLYEGALLRIP